MSSDVQRYSTENQQSAIAEYAREHGYEVVASYIDAGKSGLSLHGRKALKQLLSDALAAHRAFEAILVFDVSRWGRFQNPDEAGHYEFLCRQAGVRVVYCAEPFGEDVAPITTIVKHLKRVMAGEYSRELSAKLSRAKLQQSQLGFRQGGGLIYGFRRVLVDAKGSPRRVLNRGERKALTSEKVMVVPGLPEELAVIRKIFRLYVRDQLCLREIARRLAEAGIRGYGDKPLGWWTIRHILCNELCVGKMTYNVTTRRLQGRTIKNPEPLWTRTSVFDPVVPVTLFRKAQARLLSCAPRQWKNEEILSSLRRLLAEKGRLSEKLINDAEGAPSSETIAKRYGSLLAAYAAVGYAPPSEERPFGQNGRYWSKQAILNGLQRLYGQTGHISNRLIDRFSDLPSQRNIRRRFGSIPEAMRQAGLPVISYGESQRLSWMRRKVAGWDDYILGVRWTSERLLRALRKLEEHYGYVSVNLLDQNNITPRAYYFIKRFGSLAKARALANLPARNRSQIMLGTVKRKKEGKTVGRKPRHPEDRSRRRYQSDDILFSLKRLAKRKGTVSARLIDEDPNLPSWSTVVNYFGSLSAAYRLAGLVRLDSNLVRFGPAK